MYKYIEFGNFKIPMYSLMMTIGIFLTFIIIYFEFKNETKKDKKKIMFILFYGITLMGVFAFLFNSLFHSIKAGKIIWNGITWLGGLIGGIPSVIILYSIFFPSRKKESLIFVSRLFPAIAIAHAFGRIGCFFSGCCFGTVTDSFLGVVYPVGSTAAVLYPGLDGRSLPLVPTQLFEAFFEFILFVIFMINNKRNNKLNYDVQDNTSRNINNKYLNNKYLNIEIYFIGYGIFRFIIEYFRGDNRGSVGLPISPSQLISIILIILGLVLIYYNIKRKNKKINMGV